jgi:hypothetical protein
MVKVPCNCTFYGCGGRDVDHRTQQSHALKDRMIQGRQQADALKDNRILLAQKATEAAEQAIQDQLNTITQHLATTTLSDSASSADLPADSNPDLPRYVDPPTMKSPSRRAHIQRVLECLSEIEFSADALDEEVTTQLCRSQLPSFLNAQSFPLAQLVDKCRYLDADLAKITLKSAAVTAAKNTIKNQLKVIAQNLQTAKKTWKEKREAVRSSKPAECTLEYSTGQ